MEKNGREAPPWNKHPRTPSAGIVLATAFVFLVGKYYFWSVYCGLDTVYWKRRMLGMATHPSIAEGGGYKSINGQHHRQKGSTTV